MMHRAMISGLVATSLLLAGCATSPNDPNRNAKEKGSAGALMGAVVGAVVGYQTDPSGGAIRGALAGAAIGGLSGAALGTYMDQQQAEFERQLAAERRNNQIEIERLKNESLRITVSNEISFDYDSAAVKPAFEPTLDKVADVLARYEKTTVRIIGHTDSTGTSAYNQQLSEDRAHSVGWYLQDHGVARHRVVTEGRGEAQPRVSNDTEAGRQLNRRVELLIIPNRD